MSIKYKWKLKFLKTLSGTQNRKRNDAKEADIKKQNGALNTFVKIVKYSNAHCNQLDTSEIKVDEPCTSSSLHESTIATIEKDNRAHGFSEKQLVEDLVEVDHETNTLLVSVNLEAKSKTTIDCQTQCINKIEKKHWTSVLERLIEIIKFLGSQNLTFRGSSDKI